MCGVTECWCGSWSLWGRCLIPGLGQRRCCLCSSLDTGWTNLTNVLDTCEYKSRPPWILHICNTHDARGAWGKTKRADICKTSFGLDTNWCWTVGTLIPVADQDSRRSRRSWRQGFYRAQTISTWSRRRIISPQLTRILLRWPPLIQGPVTGLGRTWGQRMMIIWPQQNNANVYFSSTFHTSPRDIGLKLIFYSSYNGCIYLNILFKQ